MMVKTLDRKFSVTVIFILLISSILLYNVYFLLPRVSALINFTSFQVTENEIDNKTKYILFWSNLFTKKNWEIDFDVIPSNKDYTKTLQCPQSCVFTTNKSLLGGDIHKFDAIVYHIGQPKKKEMPIEYKRDSRSYHQKYIFGMKESPDNTDRKYKYKKFYQLNNFFNWTMTYR